jgi:hypothetical protein
MRFRAATARRRIHGIGAALDNPSRTNIICSSSAPNWASEALTWHAR